MNFLFAPLEGITTSIYRSAHAEFFGDCDGFFSPFITPSENERITKRTLRDVLPENNPNVKLTVQVLCKEAGAFLNFENKLKLAGFDEININLGCPSGTVVGKGRGSGFLKDTDGLDAFLYEIFEKSSMKISVKSRIGYFDAEEFPKILEIYNKYPISLLTIHPRTREMQYGGSPDLDAFRFAYENSKNPLCYNGDVLSKQDADRISAEFPKLLAIMIGRGALRNPAIFRELKGGGKLTKAELLEFSNLLLDRYFEAYKNDVFVIHKLKEIWIHVMKNFPEDKKTLKAIKKSRKITEFKEAMRMIGEF